MGLITWIIMGIMTLTIIFGAGFIWENWDAYVEYSKEELKNIPDNVAEGLQSTSSDELVSTLCGRFGLGEVQEYLQFDDKIEVVCKTNGG